MLRMMALNTPRPSERSAQSAAKYCANPSLSQCSW